MFLLQTAADSTLAGDIGSVLGNQVTYYVLAGLGLLTKLITSLIGKVLPIFDAQSDTVKAVIALVFAEAITFLNWKVGFQLSPDITLLGVTLAGVATWGVSMGWGWLAKFIPAKKTV